MNTLRTIQVINVRWFNATAWYGLYLAKLLRDAGHESLVITLPDTDTDAKAREWGFTPMALPLTSNAPHTLASTYFAMRRLIKEFNPHIVNCHRGESFFQWGLLKKQLGSFRLVRTRGDQRLPKNNLPNRWLHKNVADAVVATNSVMANHFINALGIPADNIHTIFGGVDTDRFAYTEEGRNAVRAEFGYTDDALVVGMLGRFDEVKGQKELIEAVGKLYRQGMTNIRLMLLGFETATKQAEVESWIAQNNVQDITVITGKRQDISACLSAVDLGIVASKWSETIARAALELMACKRPLLSTDVGVMPDLMPAQALFQKESADALANAIHAFAVTPELRESIYTEQQQTISRLSGNDFLQQTLGLYQSIL